MEIIRTVQASSGSGTTARVGALWTGVGATLARDVPFSALYWALLEPVRTFLLPDPQASSALADPVSGPTFRPHSYSSSPAGAGPAPSAPARQPSASASQGSAEDADLHARSEKSEDAAAASGRAPVQWVYSQHAQHAQHSSAAAGAEAEQGGASSSGRADRVEPGQVPWPGQQGIHGGISWHGQSSSVTDAQQKQQQQDLVDGRCCGTAGSDVLEASRAAELKDRGSVQARHSRIISQDTREK